MSDNGIVDLAIKINDMKHEQTQREKDLAKHEAIKTMAERIVDLEEMVVTKSEKIRELETRLTTIRQLYSEQIEATKKYQERLYSLL